MCSLVRHSTMVYLRVRIRVVDNPLLLINPVSVRPISRGMSGAMRGARSLLVVVLIPIVTLLLTSVPVPILFRRTTIGRRLWHCGRGTRHTCVMRRTYVIAVVLFVVRLFFRDQGAAAADGTELFGVAIGFAIFVALEVGFLAGAGGIVIRRGGAV